MNIAKNKELIVLFDESGVPTFNFKKNEKIFLGVAIIYEKEREEDIFNECEFVMGLSNKNPLKFSNIKNQRAIDIAQLLSKYLQQVQVVYINLNDPKLKNNVNLYKDFGDYVRDKERGVKQRNISHILHSHTIEPCLFNILSCFLVNRNEGVYNFDLFIDNWKYPISDKQIALEDSSIGLENKLTELINQDINIKSKIHVSSRNLLDDSNSKRKRFIDVTTSIISKSFRDKNDKKYSTKPLEILIKKLGSKIDVMENTNEIIDSTRKNVIKWVEETRNKDNRIIIP